MTHFPKSPSTRRRKEAGHFLAVVAVLFGCLLLIAIAAPPAWWGSRGVTDSSKSADDYAAINQGQLKHLVKGAVQELDAGLPGGAGEALHGLVEGWTDTPGTDDYAAVNLGQLKAVAKPVYDRLIAAGYTDGYPWPASPPHPDNYAVANIGQAKNLFSFDVTRDTSGAGVPDWWLLKNGIDPASAGGPQALGANGVPYAISFRFGINPAVAKHSVIINCVCCGSC